MSENLAVRWMRRYKVFFLIGLLILGIQIFLAYKSLGINNLYSTGGDSDADANVATSGLDGKTPNLHSSHDIGETQGTQQKRDIRRGTIKAGGNSSTISLGTLTVDQLGFQPECNINAKEAISALQRAKTIDCKKHIAHVACSIQAGHFYAHQLHSYCPSGNHTANASLGCYRDEKEFRLLSGYFTNFKTTNSPQRCIQLCLQSGYPYAGVQYGTECFCGSDAPLSSAKLADSKCNMKCSGVAKEICGGYFSMNVYETGIASEYLHKLYAYHTI